MHIFSRYITLRQYFLFKSHIQGRLNLLTCSENSTNTKKNERKKKKKKTCHLSSVTCHMSPFFCHLTTTLCSYESPRMLGDLAEGSLFIDRVKKIYLTSYSGNLRKNFFDLVICFVLQCFCLGTRNYTKVG